MPKFLLHFQCTISGAIRPYTGVITQSLFCVSFAGEEGDLSEDTVDTIPEKAGAGQVEDCTQSTG